MMIHSVGLEIYIFINIESQQGNECMITFYGEVKFKKFKYVFSVLPWDHDDDMSGADSRASKMSQAGALCLCQPIRTQDFLSDQSQAMKQTWCSSPCLRWFR